MSIRNIPLGFRVRSCSTYLIEHVVTRGGRIPAVIAHRIEDLYEEYGDSLRFEGETPSGEWRPRKVIGDARKGMFVRLDHAAYRAQQQKAVSK